MNFKRVKKASRARIIALLARTGQLDRVIGVKHRIRSARADREERIAHRDLDAAIAGLRSERSRIVAAWLGGSSRHGVVARVRDFDRVVDAMDANRGVVLEALERADVRFQPVPVDSAHRYRIAVPASSRAELMTALAEIDVTVHVYFDWSSIPRSQRVVRLSGAAPATLERWSESARVWRVFEYHARPDGTDVFGDLHGCEVEFWTEGETDSLVRSARWNEFAVSLPQKSFGRRVPECTITSQVDFPIDIVYTWVDGDDPQWMQRRVDAGHITGTEKRHAEAASDARFASRDELRYSLRSVERYADFVNHIFVVTDQQRPDWMVDESDRLTVIDHTEIFDDPAALPTFNSHSIESRLHHIPGLSEHYLYLNDDFFFGRRVLPERFFYANGLAKHFLSRALIPTGEPSLANKPVDAAAMNGRRLVEGTFRMTPTRKFKHAPYPQIKSVGFEIEDLFEEDMRRTMHSKFRHPSDLAVASSLHHHVGFMTGKSMPGRIEARYVDLGAPNLEARLFRLLRNRDFDSLCLNDTDAGEIDAAEKSRMVGDFLERYYPVASQFER